MAKRRRESGSDSTTPTTPATAIAIYNTIFIDTSLDTHLAITVSDSDTISILKEKIVAEHNQCFPDTGKIKIDALKVKRRGFFYHLPDYMHVKSAFEGVKNNWFLYIDVSVLKEHNDVDLSHQKALVCIEHLPKVHDQEDERSKTHSAINESANGKVPSGALCNDISSTSGRSPLIVQKSDVICEKSAETTPEIKDVTMPGSSKDVHEPSDVNVNDILEKVVESIKEASSEKHDKTEEEEEYFPSPAIPVLHDNTKALDMDNHGPTNHQAKKIKVSVNNDPEVSLKNVPDQGEVGKTIEIKKKKKKVKKSNAKVLESNKNINQEDNKVDQGFVTVEKEEEERELVLHDQTEVMMSAKSKDVADVGPTESELPDANVVKENKVLSSRKKKSAVKTAKVSVQDALEMEHIESKETSKRKLSEASFARNARNKVDKLIENDETLHQNIQTDVENSQDLGQNTIKDAPIEEQQIEIERGVHEEANIVVGVEKSVNDKKVVKKKPKKSRSTVGKNNEVNEESVAMKEVNAPTKEEVVEKACAQVNENLEDGEKKSNKKIKRTKEQIAVKNAEDVILALPKVSESLVHLDTINKTQVENTTKRGKVEDIQVESSVKTTKKPRKRQLSQSGISESETQKNIVEKVTETEISIGDVIKPAQSEVKEVDFKQYFVPEENDVSKNLTKSNNKVIKTKTKQIEGKKPVANTTKSCDTTKSVPARVKESDKRVVRPSLSSNSVKSFDKTPIMKKDEKESILKRNVMTNSKKSTSMVKKEEKQVKSLLSTPKSIFQEESNESSSDENADVDSDASTRTPSDKSSSSGYSSDESDVSKNSTKNGTNGVKRKETELRKTQQIPMDMLFRSSSRFKKAKLTASQQQIQDSEIQGIEFVPDSLAN